jgi:cbb3-type cytochrome oxidase cytochrome c subunit
LKLRADRRVGLLLGGVVLLMFVAIGATIALPATDSSLTGEATELSEAEERGMKVYRSEGCWYCHSQYVRDSERGGDEPLDPASYSGRSPSMLGLERLGPDLTYGPALTGSALTEFLVGGEEGHAPPYGYLSDDDLEALTAYLLSLQ